MGVTPFAFSPVLYFYDQSRLAKEITAQILIVIILSAWIFGTLTTERRAPTGWKQRVRSPLFIALGLLLLWSGINVGLSNHAGLGRETLWNIFLYAGLFAALSGAANGNSIKTVLYIALAAGALNALYGVVQYYGYDVLFRVDPRGTRALGRQGTAGFLDNPDVAGAYLALTLTAGVGLLWQAASSVKRRLIVAALCIILVGLGYTQTLTAMAGAVAGLMVWAFFIYHYQKAWRKYLVGAFILLIMLTGVFAAVNQGFRQRIGAVRSSAQARDWDKLLSRRYAIWATTIRMIQDRPLIGHGLNSHRALFFEYNIQAMQQAHTTPIGEIAVEAHNEYLQIWAELGLLGLALCLGVVFLYVKVQTQTLRRARTATPEPVPPTPKTVRAPPHEPEAARTDAPIFAMGSLAILANVLINSIANFPFHVAATASLIVVILALSLEPIGAVGVNTIRADRAGPEERILKGIAALATLVLAFWVISDRTRPYRASQLQLQALLTMQRVEARQLAPGESLPGLLSRAGAMLEEAKGLDPTNHNLYMLRGAAYRWERRFDKALSEYQSSVRYQPTPEAYLAMGRVYLDLQQAENARGVYRHLLQFNSRWETAQAGLAEAEAKLKKPAPP